MDKIKGLGKKKKAYVFLPPKDKTVVRVARKTSVFNAGAWLSLVLQYYY